ncbi:MAG: hypothetical protein CVT99_15475 [Bacteroidetes bacterium HGW-Bacteroidetes-16]|jgi:hypothetical protein|nr:MAG: hypothetical protein CVT99_15475 [Bacteroidetes bacterium HGW-Bacteroidetes-16]
MQPISFLTKEDIKAAVLEALSESKPQQQSKEPEIIIHGLQGLADFLGVGITTAWSLKKAGKIPFYQAGKKLFFKMSEVLAATSKTL